MKSDSQIQATDPTFLLLLLLLVVLMLLPRLLPRLLVGFGRYVSTQTVLAKLKSGQELLLLDVRMPKEFYGELGHIPGAVLLPLERLSAAVQAGEPWLADFRKKPVILICQSDMRAGIAARKLKRAGYDKVLVMSGGMQAWREDFLPVK